MRNLPDRQPRFLFRFQWSVEMTINRTEKQNIFLFNVRVAAYSNDVERYVLNDSTVSNALVLPLNGSLVSEHGKHLDLPRLQVVRMTVWCICQSELEINK